MYSCKTTLYFFLLLVFCQGQPDPPEPGGNVERLFFLEVYQIASDIVTQCSWQSLVNIMVVLQLIHARHPWLKRCHETSDNASNYRNALFELGLRMAYRIAMIHVVESANNEPCCGKNIGDTLGSVAMSGAMKYALEHTILDAFELVTALNSTAPEGHISRVASYKDTPEEAATSGSLNLQSQTIYHRVYEELGMRFRQFLGIGPGIFLSHSVLNDVSHSGNIPCDALWDLSEADVKSRELAKGTVTGRERLIRDEEHGKRQMAKKMEQAKQRDAGIKEHVEKRESVKIEHTKESGTVMPVGKACKDNADGNTESKQPAKVDKDGIVAAIRESVLTCVQERRGESSSTAAPAKDDAGLNTTVNHNIGMAVVRAPMAAWGWVVPRPGEVFVSGSLNGMTFDANGVIVCVAHGSWAYGNLVRPGYKLISVSWNSKGGPNHDVAQNPNLWMIQLRESRGGHDVFVRWERTPPPLVSMGAGNRVYDAPCRKSPLQLLFLEKRFAKHKGKGSFLADIRAMEQDPMFDGKRDLVFDQNVDGDKIIAWMKAKKSEAKKGVKNANVSRFAEWDTTQLEGEMCQRGFRVTSRSTDKSMRKRLDKAYEDDRNEALQAETQTYDCWDVPRLRAECTSRGLITNLDQCAEVALRQRLLDSDFRDSDAPLVADTCPAEIAVADVHHVETKSSDNGPPETVVAGGGRVEDMAEAVNPPETEAVEEHPVPNLVPGTRVQILWAMRGERSAWFYGKIDSHVRENVYSVTFDDGDVFEVECEPNRLHETWKLVKPKRTIDPKQNPTKKTKAGDTHNDYARHGYKTSNRGERSNARTKKKP